MAAIESIAKRGSSNTTFKHVPEGAKLLHVVANYHFDNKESLYDETPGYLADEHYGLWLANMLAANPDAASQPAAITEADFDKKICNEFDDEGFEEILRHCSDLIKQAGSSHLNPKSTARSLQALIGGLWLYPAAIKRNDCLNDCFRVLAQFFPDHFDHKNSYGEPNCIS